MTHRFAQWFLLALMTTTTGCLADSGAQRDTAVADPREAILNPAPRQIVKLQGRVPPSLRFEFRVRYTMEDVKAEGCRPRDATGGFLPMLGDFTRVETLQPRYLDGNRYEAELVVDKYLPGPCGWAFDEVKAAVVKDGKVGDRNFTTGTTSPVIDNNTDGKFTGFCTEFSDHECPFRQNSDPTPVLLLCSIGSMPYPKPRDYFTCGNRFPGARYKQTHLLDAKAQEISLDFHDLTLEPSPIPLNLPQSTEAVP